MENKQNPQGIFKNIWLFFASVKLSMIVLLLLAMTSIIGTLIPQNGDPALYYSKYGESVFKLFTLFNLFDMYHSWWFSSLLLCLALNITICSIERLSSTWKIVFKKNISFNLDRFQNLTNREKISLDTSLSEKSFTDIKNSFQKYITKTVGRCEIVKINDGKVALFSETGRWSRLGVYGVHLSILLLLLGAMAGSFYGFEGYVQISEGEKTDIVSIRKSNEKIKLPFEIQCDKFHVSFYKTGAPEEYRSTLTLLRDGKTLEKKDIVVNDPMRFEGINIFQSSYGTATPKKIIVEIGTNDLSMLYDKELKMGETIALPGGMGQFKIKNFINNYNFRGHRLGETFIGEVIRTNGETFDILLPVKYANFDKMRKGKFFVSVKNFTSNYYTGLQVTNDPGVWIVYIGFIMMIIGCYIAFFISHRIYCVEIEKIDDRCYATVSGIANRNKIGMNIKVKAFAGKLSNL